MKKQNLFTILVIALCAFYACKSNKQDNVEVQLTPTENLSTFVFKVENITDPVISDTLWKMIFNMNEGVDQISISQDDSTIVFKIDEKVYSKKDIVKEMKKRGALSVVTVN